MTQMPQAVYICVMSWLGEIPAAAHFEHIARRRLGCIATVHLKFSAASWSPSRSAVLHVALRLIISWGSRRMEAMERLEDRLGRQWHRALQPAMNLSPQDTVTVRLRRLVRMYRVSAEVTRRLVRSRPDLSETIADIQADVERQIVEDVSSSSSEGSSEDR